jgi:hypothetical protein
MKTNWFDSSELSFEGFRCKFRMCSAWVSGKGRRPVSKVTRIQHEEGLVRSVRDHSQNIFYSNKGFKGQPIPVLSVDTAVYQLEDFKWRYRGFTAYVEGTEKPVRNLKEEEYSGGRLFGIFKPGLDVFYLNEAWLREKREEEAC